MQGQYIIHHGRLAQIGAWDELGLLSGFGGRFDQDTASYLRPDIPGFSVFQNVDDQPDGAVAPVAGPPCFAIRNGDTD